MLPVLAINPLFGVITLIFFFKAISTIFFEMPSDRPTHSKRISIFSLLKILIGFL